MVPSTDELRLLVVNCGSSTLKLELSRVARGKPDARRSEAGAIVDRIGDQAEITVEGETGEAHAVADHGEALEAALAALERKGLASADDMDAVAHRVVHGGQRFTEPVSIDDEALEAIRELTELAPLHNGPALGAIEAARRLLGAEVPMVAVFDTAFHAALPERAARYPIPTELAERHGIRRFGFHGLAHRYMSERCADLLERPLDSLRLITLQLGAGASAAAIAGGRSIDTSMGLTPLEGLMMATRSGDLDPALVGFLAQAEATDPAEVERWLNERSGLLGVSGRSADMRELLAAAERGEGSAELAVEMFCYRARKYLGAYLAALGGADAVAFGGGIGENAPEVRRRACAGMAWSGLELDEARNDRAVGTEARIDAGGPIRAYVISVDEAAVIAADTIRCLAAKPPGTEARR